MSTETSWPDWVYQNADNLYMGTSAHHKLGDISRTNPDVFISRDEIGDQHVGEWLMGFGFVGVTFPKETSRPLTRVELAWLAEHPVALA